MAQRQMIVLERGKNRERKKREEYKKIKTQKERETEKKVIKVQRQQRFHLANNKLRALPPTASGL